jgi:hypothetical protein
MHWGKFITVQASVVVLALLKHDAANDAIGNRTLLDGADFVDRSGLAARAGKAPLISIAFG